MFTMGTSKGEDINSVSKHTGDLNSKMDKSDPLRYSQSVNILITPIKYWSGLAVITSIGILGWSVFGRIPEKTTSSGFITKPFLLASVGQSASSDGTYSSILIKPGDKVVKGQLLATVSFPALTQKVAEARTQLQIAKTQHESQYETSSFANYLNEQKSSLQSSKDYLTAAQNIAKTGAISETTVRNAKQSYQSSMQSLLSTQGEVIESNSNIAKLQTTLNAALTEKKEASDIRSPYSGTVLNIFRSIGQPNIPGNPLLQLEINSNGQPPLQQKRNLAVISFFTPTEAAKLKVGQEVHVLPSNIQQNTVGNVLGRVAKISLLPITQSEASGILGSKELASELLQDDKTIQVTIYLNEDKQSPSGFKWINGSGPPSNRPSQFPRVGLEAQVSVITKRIPPITLGVPALKKFFGIGS